VPRLVAASLQAPPGLLDFIREARDDGNGFPGENEVVSGDLTLEAFLRNLVDWSAGHNLPEGWVPFTTFWLLDDYGAVVGVSRLRHTLNDFLLNHGGHIGYYVARDQRGKRYGTQILALTLPHARALALDRVLLTVDSDNEPSIRVIERNGGVLEEECIDSTTGRLHRRYWIDLT
jgi:predicted acetyltransferase